MNPLDPSFKKCVPCRSDAPPMSIGEIAVQLERLQNWELLNEKGVQQLRKSYEFPSYAQALVFVNGVAKSAEEEKHHPLVIFAYKKVDVSWWTHVINGLHVNDFVMAKHCDELYGALK